MEILHKCIECKYEFYMTKQAINSSYLSVKECPRCGKLNKLKNNIEDQYNFTMPANITNKPWGAEILLWKKDTFDPGAVVKLLMYKKGEECSYQYHNKKYEVMILVEGKASLEVEYFPTRGIFHKDMQTFEPFLLKPHDKHKVVAHEDSIIVEISTNHLDDVVRISDKYGRI